MLPKFEAARVWSYLLAINMPASERVNVFMAVPTIYMKLVEEYDRIFTKNARMQEYIRTVCTQKIRYVSTTVLPKLHVCMYASTDMQLLIFTHHPCTVCTEL